MQTVTTDKRESYGYKAVVVKDYYHTTVWQEYNKKTKTYEVQRDTSKEPTIKAGSEFFFSAKRDLKAASPGGEGLFVSAGRDCSYLIPPEYLKLYQMDYVTVITKTVTETEI